MKSRKRKELKRAERRFQKALEKMAQAVVRMYEPTPGVSFSSMLQKREVVSTTGSN